MADIGGSIRAARKAAGLSQEELARKAELSLNGIAILERGKRKDPHYSTLYKIAKALGTTPEGLIAEPVDPGKARAAASRASKAAADAKRRTREFYHEGIEAQYTDLVRRTLAAHRAGDEAETQSWAEEAHRVHLEVLEHYDELTKVRFDPGHAWGWGGSPEEEELRVWAQELYKLHERLNDVGMAEVELYKAGVKVVASAAERA